ncbi:hypothetical protein FACS1894191_3690 [Clostridia bacterium]|nr:hypothetical protein FACS1894191_3690 [Clostridia bacterium]
MNTTSTWGKKTLALLLALAVAFGVLPLAGMVIAEAAVLGGEADGPGFISVFYA